MASLHSPTALIAEVILYSEGFESSKNLARKMTQMYKLCSEQLSQQDHYDFGMRAVKSVSICVQCLECTESSYIQYNASNVVPQEFVGELQPLHFLHSEPRTAYMILLVQVLVMAGQLKRENPDIQEDLVLIRALRDSNLPKFLADDAILFKVSVLDDSGRCCRGKWPEQKRKKCHL